jgi:hypothetical protein
MIVFTHASKEHPQEHVTGPAYLQSMLTEDITSRALDRSKVREQNVYLTRQVQTDDKVAPLRRN